MYLIPVAEYRKKYAEYRYNKERHIKVSGVARQHFVQDEYAYQSDEGKTAADKIFFQHSKEHSHYIAYNGE